MKEDSEECFLGVTQSEEAFPPCSHTFFRKTSCYSYVLEQRSDVEVRLECCLDKLSFHNILTAEGVSVGPSKRTGLSYGMFVLFAKNKIVRKTKANIQCIIIIIHYAASELNNVDAMYTVLHSKSITN